MVKNLYENLRKLLKHFSMTPKSSELLTNALAAMEMHDVHLLNWGSTRMVGLLDACVQASKIMVPFLDSIISNNRQPYKTKYITSPKGQYVNIILFKCVKLILKIRFLDFYGSLILFPAVVLCFFRVIIASII